MYKLKKKDLLQHALRFCNVLSNINSEALKYIRIIMILLDCSLQT